MPRNPDQLEEFPFIDAVARLARYGRGVRIGIGDDAALIKASPSTLVTTDTVTEGVHFRREWLTAAALGRRAFRVAVSDIAAMGGRPRYVLLSLSLPTGFATAEGRRLVGGLLRDAEAAGAGLIGGNVARASELSLTVTVIGEAGRHVPTRAAARARQAVFVTGALGSARAGIELLEAGVRRGALVGAYRCPPLRLAVGSALAKARVARAMIDISDGLVQDLGHVCRASGVSMRIDTDAVPVARALARAVADPRGYALAGGDDYELAFTTAARKAAEAEELCVKHGCKVTRIGTVLARGSRATVLDESGRRLEGRHRGFTHFSGAKGSGRS